MTVCRHAACACHRKAHATPAPQPSCPAVAAWPSCCNSWHCQADFPSGCTPRRWEERPVTSLHVIQARHLSYKAFCRPVPVSHACRTGRVRCRHFLCDRTSPTRQILNPPHTPPSLLLEPSAEVCLLASSICASFSLSLFYLSTSSNSKQSNLPG